MKWLARLLELLGTWWDRTGAWLKREIADDDPWHQERDDSDAW